MTKMMLHYLVVWIVGTDMATRQETPIDLELETRDEESAEFRYQYIKHKLSTRNNITMENVKIINICRL